MNRLLFGGIWVCAVTIASVYAAAIGTGGARVTSEESVLRGLDYVSTREISVPRIAEGTIRGYVVARFVFTIDAEKKARLPVPVEAFVVDEAFRAIYSDDATDFSHLQKTDLAALTDGITKGVNARLQADLVHETLVDEFSYVPYETLGESLAPPSTSSSALPSPAAPVPAAGDQAARSDASNPTGATTGAPPADPVAHAEPAKPAAR